MGTPGADRFSDPARRPPGASAEPSPPYEDLGTGTVGVLGIVALAFVAIAYLATLVHLFLADPLPPSGLGAGGPSTLAAIRVPGGAGLPNTVARAADLFRDADLDHGERLLAERDCSSCHERSVGGDGAAIYRRSGRIDSPTRLVAMVEYCDTQLGLQLFPEDVTAIAAVLNRDHYRFD